MDRLSKLCVGTMLLVMLLAVVLTTGALAEDNNTIEVVVSPNVLNLNSKGGSVSLHTDIVYDDEDGVELYVEDNPVDIWTFADDRGDLVVKCDIDTVKGLVAEVDEATFVLEVTAKDGTSYSGADTIAVIACGGK